MRIAILYEVLGRSRGGIEAWIYHASEELIQQGHEVTVFNTQKEKPVDALPDGANSVFLSLPSYLPSCIAYIIRAMKLRQQLVNRLNKFDYVWSRSFVMAYIASTIGNKNNTIYINAAPYPMYGRIPLIEFKEQAMGVKNRLKLISREIGFKIAYAMEKYAIKNSKNVYLSKSRRNETFSYYNLKIESNATYIVPPGVNITRFFPSKISWKGKGKFKIITVCRLVPDKNVQSVIRAVHELKRRKYSILLMVVGDGRYKSELVNLAEELGLSEDIMFVGRKKNIEKWYNKSHAFVLTSLYEGFGSVYIEAMASGLPCIALNGTSGKYKVATNEIIDHEINGYLMREDDPFELAEYIIQIIDDSEKWKVISNAARYKAVSQYSWNTVIKELLWISKQ